MARQVVVEITGLYWENGTKMEAIIAHCRVISGVGVGSGKENGNYYLGLGFRGQHGILPHLETQTRLPPN